jgi:hypothetical protein
MTFWLSNRLFKQLPVLTRPTRRLLHPPVLSLPRQPLCPKACFSPGKAAGEKQPEVYRSHLPNPNCQSSSFPMGYIEDCLDLRTPLEGCINNRQVVTC